MKSIILIFLIIFAAKLHAQNDEEIRNFIVSFEGYRIESYSDGSYVSAGIGHQIINGKIGIEYSQEQIENWFKYDLMHAKLTAITQIENWYSLPKEIRLVCLSIIWGVGDIGFKRFINFRLAISSRQFRLAANELRKSKWAKQVGAGRTESHIYYLIKFQ